MSRTLFKEDSKKDKCFGPLEHVTNSFPINIILEKLKHFNDTIISPDCEKLRIEKSCGICQINYENPQKCKYWNMDKNKSINYYNSLKQ